SYCSGTKPAASQSCNTQVCPTNGSCGSANGVAVTSYPTANHCSAGTKVDVDTIATDGTYNWTCNGSNGGTTVSCQANKTAPVNGVCGSMDDSPVLRKPTSNLCSVGTASTVSGSGPWNWTCTGSNGGTTESCSTSVCD
ncbi:MAG: hypothetical protein LBG59_00145, partial [Candidatus Peribacteria bacterium]|nr:hypothetical protein [Candidatus Peribacteria bacterium]